MSPAKRLDLAGALLAKARSTEFSAEQQAFAAGAMEQLSAYLGRSADRGAPSGGSRPASPLVGRAGSAYRVSTPQRGVRVDLSI